MAIVDFHKDSPEGPPREFRFTAEQIEAEMKQAGYTLQATHAFLPRQTFQIFRRSRPRGLRPLGRPGFDSLAR